MMLSTENMALLVAGLLVCALGFWLFRRLGRLAAEGRPWLKGEVAKNLLVLVMLGTWCTGIVLIGYGLGLGGKLQ